MNDDTRPSGRHQVSIGHLVMGIAFLFIVGIWALVQSDTVTGDDVRWLLPIPWVVAGVVGLVAGAVVAGALVGAVETLVVVVVVSAWLSADATATDAVWADSDPSVTSAVPTSAPTTITPMVTARRTRCSSTSATG